MRTLCLLAASLLLAACPAGPPGPSGEMGEPGANGKDGTNGKDGANGTNGEDGADGMTPDSLANYSPKFWVGCSAALDVVDGTDGIKETAFSYRIVLYSNGDTQVDCEVNSVESAAGGAYFPAITKGASEGSCIAGVDFPPFPVGAGEAGFWKFAITKDGPRTTYSDSDPGHPLNGDFYQFEENDCSVFVMGKDGKWSDSSLADAF